MKGAAAATRKSPKPLQPAARIYAHFLTRCGANSGPGTCVQPRSVWAMAIRKGMKAYGRPLPLT